MLTFILDHEYCLAYLDSCIRPEPIKLDAVKYRKGVDALSHFLSRYLCEIKFHSAELRSKEISQYFHQCIPS